MFADILWPLQHICPKVTEGPYLIAQDKIAFEAKIMEEAIYPVERAGRMPFFNFDQNVRPVAFDRADAATEDGFLMSFDVYLQETQIIEFEIVQPSCIDGKIKHRIVFVADVVRKAG